MDKEKRLETVGELRKYLDEKFKVVVPMEFKGKEYMGDIARKLNDALQNDRKEIFMDAGMVALSAEVGEPRFVGEIVITYTEIDKLGQKTSEKTMPLLGFDFNEKKEDFIVKKMFFKPVPYVNDECSLCDAAQLNILIRMANKAETLDRQVEILDSQIEAIQLTQRILHAEAEDAITKREDAIEKLISSDTFANILGFPANMCLQHYVETSEELATLIENKEEISKKILSELKELNLWSEEEKENDSFEKRYTRMVYVKRASQKHAEEVFIKEYGEKKFYKMLNGLFATLSDICTDVFDDYCGEDFSEYMINRLIREREDKRKEEKKSRKENDFHLVQ